MAKDKNDDADDGDEVFTGFNQQPRKHEDGFARRDDPRRDDEPHRDDEGR